MSAAALNPGPTHGSVAPPAWSVCVPLSFHLCVRLLFGYLPGGVLSARWDTEVNGAGARGYTCTCVYLSVCGRLHVMLRSCRLTSLRVRAHVRERRVGLPQASGLRSPISLCPRMPALGPCPLTTQAHPGQGPPVECQPDRKIGFLGEAEARQGQSCPWSWASLRARLCAPSCTQRRTQPLFLSHTCTHILTLSRSGAGAPPSPAP